MNYVNVRKDFCGVFKVSLMFWRSLIFANVLKEFNFINCLRKILMIHFITYQAKQENGSKRNQAVVVYRPEPPAGSCPHPPSSERKWGRSLQASEAISFWPEWFYAVYTIATSYIVTVTLKGDFTSLAS